MNPGELRHCPECGHAWPKGPEHALRGCGWLHGLPRRISPTNIDGIIHDGQRNRFLTLELKGPSEPWPLQRGQAVTLTALAQLANFTVRILRGSTRSLVVHRVTSEGYDDDGIHTHAEAVRRGVAAWLSGSLWRDVEDSLRLAPPDGLATDAGHTCGWARVSGVWTCVQDQYAIGSRPDTGCGAVAPEFA